MQIRPTNAFRNRTRLDEVLYLILLHEDIRNKLFPSSRQNFGGHSHRMDYRLLLHESLHLHSRNSPGRAVLWKQMHQYYSHVVYGVGYGYCVRLDYLVHAYPTSHESTSSYEPKDCCDGNLPSRCYVSFVVHRLLANCKLMTAVSVQQALPAWLSLFRSEVCCRFIIMTRLVSIGHSM